MITVERLIDSLLSNFNLLMPKIQINDLSMYYEIAGDGPPVLLIYGLAGRGNGFLHQIPVLAKDYQVISFDNRGVGETDQPESVYSIPQMADDAAGLLDALGIESAYVFGVSMGGMIAQELVLRHPPRVRKLVLGCTHSGRKHCTPSPQWVTDIFKSLPGKPRAQVVSECVPFNYSPSTQKHYPEIIESLYESSLKNLQRGYAYANQLSAVYNFDSYDRLPEIKTPTLVLTGTDDVLIPPENSRDIVKRIHGAKLIEFEHAGHLFFAECAEAVNQALLEFFK
jgi:pimeloyl-ACP methyl ester carboxylesterase